MEQLEMLRNFHEKYPFLSTVVGLFTALLIVALYIYQRRIADLASAEFIYMDF